MNALDKIREITRRLDRHKSLLFLNYLVSVTNGEVSDNQMRVFVGRHKTQPPLFIVHFLAKEILLQSSDLGTEELAWRRFDELYSLYFELDDPIISDPEWKHKDPTGFFERVFSQQFPAQQRNWMQKLGLALALFNDLEKCSGTNGFDLPQTISRALGMSTEEFMALGFTAFSLQHAVVRGKKCRGTFTYLDLAECFASGLSFCVPERWAPFFERVAATPLEFRRLTEAYLRARESTYYQFEFNALKRRPLIEVDCGKFASVDPALLIDRVTLGVFFDGAEYSPDHKSFFQDFGYAFSQFVGRLLVHASDKGRVVNLDLAADQEFRHKQKKNGDWLVIGVNHNVLIECKSLRPSLELTTHGADESVEAVRTRVVESLSQLASTAEQVANGVFRNVPQKPCLSVVVTYGEIATINLPFTRQRIEQSLTNRGIAVPQYCVLSIEELDVLVSLADKGIPLDVAVCRIVSEEIGVNLFHTFRDDLKDCAVSAFAKKRFEVFMKKHFPADVDGLFENERVEQCNPLA